MMGDIEMTHGNLGKHHTKETKQKISIGLTGIKRSEEFKTKESKTKTGKKFTEEHKKNLSISHKNQQSWLKGLTKETDKRVQKISERMKGDKNPMKKIEVRKKVSLSVIENAKNNSLFGMKNKNHTLETRKRISALQQNLPINQWKKFISFEPYTEDFNKYFKNLIRKRDNQVCINCAIRREKLKKSLDVHHIDYDKTLSIFENCISLCHNCHMLTNYNREYWKQLFQDKLTKLYNYKYDLNKNIIINYGIS